MKLSIIIPAFNEECRLGPALERYASYFSPRYGDDVELIVCVNGSTDRTAEVAREAGKQYPQIKILIEPGRVGKGGAVMMGFREARGELVGFVDADGATPPEAFQDLVDRIGDADAIIASRWLPASRVEPKQPLSRRAASRVFNGLVRLLFGLALHDTQCGAKLFRGATLQRVLPKLGTTNWAFDVDLLYQVRRAGGTIREIPTTWSDAAGSKLRMGKASTEMAVALVRLRLVYSPFRFLVPVLGRAVSRVMRWGS
ncbi:dolichyl-phosphate beta-glucosyltransferase [Kiritimatiella glycovorans]|uniref:dolichyl-phosphate beta-glucosyltransferase n=1 Tax=Kiritimatiella glycovorans TaxID=1307763 RepID=A0A0G3EF11_9BACT|nr:dolichyl-phosphate beta-glucosyltransferase [Kiritimatiella glycovorans]AKJ65041.1 Glycosyl transferase family 2 [Kiritimatiella glycovorans]